MIRSTGRRRGSAVVAVMAMSLLVASCGGSGPGGSPTSQAASARPSSTATLSFVSPADGEVVNGSSIPVKLDLTGGTIVPQTSTNIRPDEGHIHLYLDDELVSMNYGLTATLKDVSAGTHLLRAEFVAADHVPFDPRDFTQVAFEVKP